MSLTTRRSEKKKYRAPFLPLCTLVLSHLQCVCVFVVRLQAELIASSLGDFLPGTDPASTADEVMYTESIVESIRNRVNDFEQTKANYVELIYFMVVVAIYFTILILQRDGFTAWCHHNTCLSATGVI